MRNFKKVVCLGVNEHGDNVFCQIEWTDGNLSITGVVGPTADGDCNGGCGQIRGEKIITPARGWSHFDVDRFYELWERWHLNDMRPGCEHQRGEWRHWECLNRECKHEWDEPVRLSASTPNVSGEATTQCPQCGSRSVFSSPVLPPWNKRPIDPSKPLDTYGKHFEGQTYDSWNMLSWIARSEHPQGLLSHPCPVCGYKYGTAWQREAVPEGVLVWFLTFPDADMTPAWI